jgi:hypothetical protein
MNEARVAPSRLSSARGLRMRVGADESLCAFDDILKAILRNEPKRTQKDDD